MEMSGNVSGLYQCDAECETNNISTSRNETSGIRSSEMPIYQIYLITCYIFICFCGLVGNGLVIYVVCRFSKMKTVTNFYILNLALSDVLFLLSLPFLIMTTIIEHWIFGRVMCKFYLVMFSINFFTNTFTLTAMSADRYLAICHPIRSVYYRTTRVAMFVCLSIWVLSFLVMLPVILYSTTVPNQLVPSRETCTISWPENQPIRTDKAFTWYTFLLGFLIPVSLICVFYISVVIRLRSVGPCSKSNKRKKSNKKVTRLVIAMICVFIVCWLPYWCFQGALSFKSDEAKVSPWQIYMFSAFTVLTFANSMFNPILYAFMSDIFKKSLFKAFNCRRYTDTTGIHAPDNSYFLRSTTRRNNEGQEMYEFTSVPETKL